MTIIELAALSVRGDPYPLVSARLIRTTSPHGRAKWSVRATPRSAYIVDQGEPHELVMVAKDGRTYTGTALLRDQPVTVTRGLPQRFGHRFDGSDALAEDGAP